MQKKVFVFYGGKGSGKDTSFELFSLLVKEETGKSVKKLSFASSLKELIYGLLSHKVSYDSIYGDIDAKEKTLFLKVSDNHKKHFNITQEYWSGRLLLQILGTEVFREIDEDIWANSLIKQLNENNAEYYAVTDCRFPNEYNVLKNCNEQVIFIKIVRNTESNSFSNHDSEKYVDSFVYDDQICNDGTLEDLTDKLRKIFQKYK